jgi:TRAP transporter TAXI family solute receptor
VRTLYRLLWLAGVFTVLLTALGCARGADESRLREDLQRKLNQGVKPDLLEVVAIRREGSAPLPSRDTKAARVIVYFNATLRLVEDYDFGGWDQLGPSSVAYALGASDQGLFGLQARNKAGDLIRAYGSAIYEQTPDGWTPIAPEPSEAAAAPNIEGSAPPPRSKQLIDRLATLVELPPPGVTKDQDEIIAEELERASESIERRVKRRERTFTVATGPQEGEYARFGASLIAAVEQLSRGIKLRMRNSQGSVENAWLLARGEADYAIVQGDVAAAALAGEEMFAKGGPLNSLRAVGGLFPEPVHVVVLPDSPIHDIAQLRGRRVDIGEPASGTRFDAVAVLAAHGLKPSDLAEAREEGLTRAVARLRSRQLDAAFVTATAPTRALQQLAARPGLRLLPIKGPALTTLLQTRRGLTTITLPPNTYPLQKEPIQTAASAALLLTTVDAPEAEVRRVTELVFKRMTEQASSADVVKVSATNELRGVTIPLHPGAAAQKP